MEIIVIATILETALAALLLALFFILQYIAKTNKPRFKNQKKAAGTVISKAIVLSAENIGSPGLDQPQMKIQLQVIPGQGRNFVVEVKESFLPEDMDHLRAGNIIYVKYNPVNTKEFVLIKPL